MTKCLTCGSPEISSENYGDPFDVLDYECGSRRQGDGSFCQSKGCRITVLDRESTDLKTRLHKYVMLVQEKDEKIVQLMANVEQLMADNAYLRKKNDALWDEAASLRVRLNRVTY